MQNVRIIVLVFGIFSGLLLSCSDDMEHHHHHQQMSSSSGDRSSSTAEKTEGGKALYMRNCAGCHGRNQKGDPPDIPSIVDVGKRRSRGGIHRIIKNGKGYMPSFSYLSEAERQAIVKFLMESPSEKAESVD